MVAWVLDARVERIVDPGCGSGRFTLAALERQPALSALAIDLDPLATLMTRANLRALDARTVRVVQADFTTVRLPAFTGRTGFIGNPPYVRHHDLTRQTKRHGAEIARALGHRFSQLAGLHAHFFLAVAAHAKRGDVGAFVTSAEWLDVAYGSIVRDLLLRGLGGRGIHVIEPGATTFEDAMTTTAIAYFEAGAQPSHLRLSFAKTPRLGRLGASAKPVSRDTLASASRWTPIVKAASGVQQERSAPILRIGHLLKVSRGQVTGANGFFVMTKERARDLGIEQFCRPAITRAHEIFAADGVIDDSEQRRVVLDPSRVLRREEHAALNAFLKTGEDTGVAKGYICSRRKPWWCVRAPRPAIVMTYMARQAPKFARNLGDLALLNVGHGLYPRVPLCDADVQRLVAVLNDSRESFRGHGRTYHGGLEKFEPREVEELPLPAQLFDLLPR